MVPERRSTSSVCHSKLVQKGWTIGMSSNKDPVCTKGGEKWPAPYRLRARTPTVQWLSVVGVWMCAWRRWLGKPGDDPPEIPKRHSVQPALEEFYRFKHCNWYRENADSIKFRPVKFDFKTVWAWVWGINGLSSLHHSSGYHQMWLSIHIISPSMMKVTRLLK